jgi:hypothetical protein
VQQLHAAVVAGAQCALGGRQGNVELTLRVLAIDEQWPRDADRQLLDAGEVLDVSGEERRVKGVAGDVLQLTPVCSRRKARRARADAGV